MISREFIDSCWAQYRGLDEGDEAPANFRNMCARIVQEAHDDHGSWYKRQHIESYSQGYSQGFKDGEAHVAKTPQLEPVS